MIKTNPYRLILILAIPIIVSLLHFFYLRNAITEAFYGRPDFCMEAIIQLIYPRFLVEKYRFDSLFFIAKADQVYFRFLLIYSLCVLASTSYYLIAKITTIRERTTSIHNITFIRIVFSCYFIHIQLELCQALLRLQEIQSFYKPTLLLQLLQLPFPSEVAIYLLGTFWILSNVFVLVKYKPYLFSILNAVFFIVIQSWYFSFEKIDHGYVTITFAAMLFPFLINEYEQQKENTAITSWSLSLIQICIAMAYLLGGLEKLLLSGISWLNPKTLQTYLTFHETTLSKIIVQSDLLCSAISTFTIVFQLTFIYILFNPKVKWIWLTGGILFHTGTLLVMKIGHPLNPWIVSYLFFIDWEKAYILFSSLFKKFHFFSK